MPCQRDIRGLEVAHLHIDAESADRPCGQVAAVHGVAQRPGVQQVAVRQAEVRSVPARQDEVAVYIGGGGVQSAVVMHTPQHAPEVDVRRVDGHRLHPDVRRVPGRVPDRVA